MTVKVCINFTLRYITYIWYGLKQRVSALFNRNIGILNFLKSLFILPFEAWSQTKIDYHEGYL